MASKVRIRPSTNVVKSENLGNSLVAGRDDCHRECVSEEIFSMNKNIRIGSQFATFSSNVVNPFKLSVKLSRRVRRCAADSSWFVPVNGLVTLKDCLQEKLYYHTAG